MKDCIIVINKPQEMTSFDVVAIMRRKLGVKRIGHLGTLDPMATGVLPIAIGKATRVMDYLEMDLKEYVAEITFGLKSDTDDIWGEIQEEINSPPNETNRHIINREDLEKAIESFRGVIEQVPPRYAAIKKDGKKLYEYARAGQEIKVEPRKIYIESIEILDYNDNHCENGLGLDLHPIAVLKIRCSKGTYIRSIARDLGEIIGCGAVMSGLIRTSSGVFKIQDAMDIQSIVDSSDLITGEIFLEENSFSIDDALSFFPKVYLGEWESKLFSTGVKLRNDQWYSYGDCINDIKEFPLELPEEFDKLYRVYDNCNSFLGVGKELNSGELKADKVFI